MAVTGYLRGLHMPKRLGGGWWWWVKGGNGDGYAQLYLPTPPPPLGHIHIHTHTQTPSPHTHPYLVVGLVEEAKLKAEKECVVEVQLPNHATIVVSKKNANAYASIREALERASRTALRKLKKRRDRQYSHQM